MEPSIEKTGDIFVIGAGPAGLFAAIHAAQAGASVYVIDGNTHAGKKLLITGGGRCNVTHAGTPRELLPAYHPYDRFMRYILHEVPPSYVVDFLQECKVLCRTESDGCVFPQTQQAVDVRDVLVRAADKAGVQFRFGRSIDAIKKLPTGFRLGIGDNGLNASKVILATGGCSYPRTGSLGAGYKLAAGLGHRIVKPAPVLVPLLTREPWSRQLAGTSLDKVRLSTGVNGKTVRTIGPLVFMQDGIGGPAVLNMSRMLVQGEPRPDHPLRIVIDLVPDCPTSDIEAALMAACTAQPKRAVPNLLASWVPKRLAKQLCQQIKGVDDREAGQLTKVQRRDLVKHLKALELSIIGTRPLAEATVTRGGVATDEINDRTMESKLCPGLFFAGEVIDVDGPCGGYNLQICWSSGVLAGRAAGSMAPVE